jgi:uncharacterized membrane protein YheB (UPF0754 family)
MDKSWITNLVAGCICLLAFAVPQYFEIIWSTGLFALSGSVTNWLAVYMLFEKVPFLYGSGVVPNRFQEFKAGIKELILEQFFTVEKLRSFISENVQGGSASLDAIDFDKAYDGLVETIESSSFGGMLAMMGGGEALEPLRDPMKERMKLVVADMFESGSLTLSPEKLREKIESIVDKRLDELTPQAVKEIVQRMIREHLGWLVVWGGVFGGVIGFLVSLRHL